ncbi:MAG TPA: hypothetical protein VGM64_22145 [Lacunisphaera sp.]|jgi:hypothetical protein
MRARFHDDRRLGITLREDREALAGVDDAFLGNDVARGIEDAHRVLAVPEIDSNRDFFRVHRT